MYCIATLVLVFCGIEKHMYEVAKYWYEGRLLTLYATVVVWYRFAYSN